VPVALVASSRVRRSPTGLAVAAASACAGLVLNRLDVGIFGYLRDAGELYLPSATEWALSLGVVAAAALVFLWAAEELPVFDDRWRSRRQSRGVFLRRFDSLSGVWASAGGQGLGRVTLIVVVAAPLAWVALYPPIRDGGATPAPVRPPTAVDAERRVLEIDGDDRGLAVRFPHVDHRDRLGKEQSCGHCHHLAVPADHATPCSRCHRRMEAPTAIFDHAGHQRAVARTERLGGLHPGNFSCRCCHAPGRAESGSTSKPCLECHREDMRPSPGQLERGLTRAAASGYRVAMHGTCIPCHRREAEARGRPLLGECRHCHPPVEAGTPDVVAPGPRRVARGEVRDATRVRPGSLAAPRPVAGRRPAAPQDL
jgi:hypothetical protein